MQTLIDIFGEGKELTMFQMMARGIVVFFLALLRGPARKREPPEVSTERARKGKAHSSWFLLTRQNLDCRTQHLSFVESARGDDPRGNGDGGE